jgi:glucokinase
MATSGPVAGIDLGGTKVRVGIVADGRLVRAESWPTEGERGPDGVMEYMAGLVRGFAGDTQLKAVGLGAPGPVDVNTGVVSTMPNVPGFDDYPILERFGQAMGLPVAVANDAKVAALAEHRFGAGRGTREMVYITLGTGIGGGLILRGRLYNGASGGAGEMGHMVIDPAGPVCSCGNHGCFEAFASGGGMEREAARRLQAGAQSSLQERARSGSEVTMHDITNAARAGDAFSKDLIARASRYLAIGVRNLIHLLNPEMIVFGGGLLAVKDLLIEPAIGAAEQYAYRQHWRDLRFAMAELGADAGVLGAAAIASDLLQPSALL